MSNGHVTFRHRKQNVCLVFNPKKWNANKHAGIEEAKLNKINNNQRIVIPGTTKADEKIDPPTKEKHPDSK